MYLQFFLSLLSFLALLFLFFFRGRARSLESSSVRLALADVPVTGTLVLIVQRGTVAVEVSWAKAFGSPPLLRGLIRQGGMGIFGNDFLGRSRIFPSKEIIR